MKKSFYSISYTMGLFALLTLSGCGDEPMGSIRYDEDNLTDKFFGWYGEDNVSEVPSSTNFGFGNSTNLPSKVDLVDKFPPIGDQGQYGTCVAWSVAYNTKTAMAGMRKGLNTSQLTASNNQYSPKDMFTALPDNKKGSDCNGTNFTDALTLMQDRGVATMQTVPYTSLGGCSQAGVQSSWTNEAQQNKIKYWRRIDPTVASIKQNLANNIPVILGAKLADNFMTWNSSAVISSGTTTNQVGQHAYHALVIAGYDDSKGANGAFRVINSWGQQWGDVGYIWMDYNYLINDFCVTFNGGKPLFIMADGDGEGNVTPPDNNPTPPNVTGVDVAPWVFNDYSTYQSSGFINERVIDFNIYNIGNQAASPSANWSIYYIYFNAYNANDYDVIFYDDFNTSIAQNTFNCPTDYNCIFNLNIPANSDFAYEAWGDQSVQRTYYMPQLNGQYYLAMLADAEDKFQEVDELNNIFYTTNEPKYFQNGWSAKSNGTAGFEFKNDLSPTKDNLQSCKHNTVVTEKNRNAYTQEEVMAFIKEEKRSGRLDQKIRKHIENKNNQTPYKKF
ncbi:MAG: C1 family peptidase [Chitinophagales bacterium]